MGDRYELDYDDYPRWSLSLDDLDKAEAAIRADAVREKDAEIEVEREMTRIERGKRDVQFARAKKLKHERDTLRAKADRLRDAAKEMVDAATRFVEEIGDLSDREMTEKLGRPVHGLALAARAVTTGWVIDAYDADAPADGAPVASTATSSVVADVLRERERQDAKWGEQNSSDFVWCAVLGEEVGEACQAALHDRFGGDHAGTLREELIHVAAVAVQWIECIDRNHPPRVGDTREQ